MASGAGDLKVIFFGCTVFSEQLLQHLVTNGISISAVFSIPESFGISYSKGKVKNYNFGNLEPICVDNDIPLHMIESRDGKSTLAYEETIHDLNPDVILVMGWYYMVPNRIRKLAKYGAWGIHASLLPKYAGGAPLVWAIINGEQETGTTLFQLEDGVDDGDILAQQKISIGPEDTIKDVYSRVTEVSKAILLESLSNIESINYKTQDKASIDVWPQRKPEDGEIDWSWDDLRIWNFVRAQSKPYPGAFTFVDGKKLHIWNREDIEKYRPEN